MQALGMQSSRKTSLCSASAKNASTLAAAPSSETAAETVNPPPTESAWQQLQSAQGQHAHKQDVFHQALLEAEKALEAAKYRYYSDQTAAQAPPWCGEDAGQFVLAFGRAAELQGDLGECEDAPTKASEAAAAGAAKRYHETDTRLRSQAAAHNKVLLELAVKEGPDRDRAPASPEEIQRRREEPGVLRERTAKERRQGASVAAGDGDAFWEHHGLINDEFYADSCDGNAGLCEMHVAEAGLPKVTSDLTLATDNGSGGTSGGETMAAKRGFATTSFDRVRQAKLAAPAALPTAVDDPRAVAADKHVHCGLHIEMKGAKDQRSRRPEAEADPDGEASKAKKRHRSERSSRLPEASAELDSHLVDWAPGARKQEEGVSRRRARLAGKIEETILDHRAIVEGDRWQCSGRGRGREVAWRRLMSTSGLRTMERKRVADRATRIAQGLESEGLLLHFGDEGCATAWCDQARSLGALDRIGAGPGRVVGACACWAEKALDEQAGLRHMVKPERPVKNELRDSAANVARLRGYLQRALEAAKQEAQGPLGQATGIDVLGSLGVDRRPLEAAQEMADLANACEAAGWWPRQRTMVMAGSFPTPAQGDRVLGEAPILPEASSKARGSAAGTWTESLGAFCEGAIKGGAFPSDRGGHADPALPGPRLLTGGHRGLNSELCPTRSAVAGSAQGASSAMVHIRQVLQRAHEVAPTCGLWTFMDDTAARMDGSRRPVVEAVRCASQFFERGFVVERGLAISENTAALASDAGLAEELWSALTTPGAPATKASKAVDLGCDAAAGRQRARKAKGPWTSGALPRAAHGAQAAGLAPWRVQELRRQAAAAAAGRARGCCFPALGGDLGVAIRREVLDSWLALWGRAPELRARIQLGAGGCRREPTPAPSARAAGGGAGANNAEWHLAQSDSEAFGSCIDHQPILHNARASSTSAGGPFPAVGNAFTDVGAGIWAELAWERCTRRLAAISGMRLRPWRDAARARLSSCLSKPMPSESSAAPEPHDRRRGRESLARIAKGLDPTREGALAPGPRNARRCRRPPGARSASPSRRRPGSRPRRERRPQGRSRRGPSSSRCGRRGGWRGVSRTPPEWSYYCRAVAVVSPSSGGPLVTEADWTRTEEFTLCVEEPPGATRDAAGAEFLAGLLEAWRRVAAEHRALESCPSPCRSSTARCSARCGPGWLGGATVAAARRAEERRTAARGRRARQARQSRALRRWADGARGRLELGRRNQEDPPPRLLRARAARRAGVVDGLVAGARRAAAAAPREGPPGGRGRQAVRREEAARARRLLACLRRAGARRARPPAASGAAEGAATLVRASRAPRPPAGELLQLLGARAGPRALAPAFQAWLADVRREHRRQAALQRARIVTALCVKGRIFHSWSAAVCAHRSAAGRLRTLVAAAFASFAAVVLARWRQD
ncbi:unnamed protein product [Prorocentrum cordatum]|uniref:Uncharacterized protein n=1 Tax=Prorocentrum cordatum TaxID=2364126 RepID=A0ABN9VKD4_9DINO|nr:unnamed protein product [Polarella glacialis]